MSKLSKGTDKQNSATWWFTRMCQAGVNNIMLKVPVCRVIVIPNHTTGTSCYKYDLLFIGSFLKIIRLVFYFLLLSKLFRHIAVRSPSFDRQIPFCVYHITVLLKQFVIYSVIKQPIKNFICQMTKNNKL